MSQTQSPQKTLFSALEDIRTNHDVSPQKTHSFASGSEDSCAHLKQLAQAADQITHSLNGYLTLPWSQPKLISLLRQQSSLTSTIRTVRHLVILNSFAAHLTRDSQKTGQENLSTRYRNMAGPYIVKTFHWIQQP